MMVFPEKEDKYLVELKKFEIFFYPMCVDVTLTL